MLVLAEVRAEMPSRSYHPKQRCRRCKLHGVRKHLRYLRKPRFYPGVYTALQSLQSPDNHIPNTIEAKAPQGRHELLTMRFGFEQDPVVSMAECLVCTGKGP